MLLWNVWLRELLNRLAILWISEPTASVPKTTCKWKYSPEMYLVLAAGQSDWFVNGRKRQKKGYRVNTGYCIQSQSVILHFAAKPIGCIYVFVHYIDNTWCSGFSHVSLHKGTHAYKATKIPAHATSFTFFTLSSQTKCQYKYQWRYFTHRLILYTCI